MNFGNSQGRLAVDGLSAAETRILELVGHLGTAEATISRLTAEQATLQNTIDVLESNARVQAKLLADTGRERDGLRKALEPFAAEKLPSAKKTEIDFNEWGLRCLMSPLEIARVRAKRALATPSPSDADAGGRT